MAGFGFWELLIVALVIVLLFGSARLPLLARSIGQSITEFKKGVKELDDKSAAGDSTEKT